MTRPARAEAAAALTENGRIVLEKRYLVRDADGCVVEAPEDLFRRVARTVASVEPDAPAWEERFLRLLASLEFVPNSPCLMNAGRRLGQLFACFVLPVSDAITGGGDDGIFDTIRSTAVIHQSGGGTGFDFSRLRPEGSLVGSTLGRSSGPLSFMRVFNAATNAIHQGGFRRGANMGILRVDHPDILDFVRLKSDLAEMTNFNLSVGVTDEFVRAVRADKPHLLLDPHTGRRFPLHDKIRDDEGNLTGFEEREWGARELFDLVVRRAWETGEPGVILLDRINDANPTPQLGRMEATNPCGEQPLLPFEACNLGSLNLVRFADPESRFEWDRFAAAVRDAVRFLDDVIDANRYPKPQIERMVKGNRKVGLGLMGWADLLYRMEVRYDSEEALALSRRLMKFVKEEAWKASMELARERGPFPNFEGSLFTSEKDHPYFADAWREETRRLGRPAPMRNATVTTIAPTGTISIIAGVSGGIEPLFSLAFHRNVLGGERLLEVNPLFSEVARREGFDRPEILERIAREGSCRGIAEIPQRWKDVFVSAHDVAPEWHVRTQAAFQEFTDNAVSKTVNFPEHATVDDVRKVYELALELGVKGVTVYRDGSRRNQPMARAAAAAPAKRRVPEVAPGRRYRVPTNLGTAFVTITEDAQGPREVFTSIGKCGSDISALSEAICRLLSTALAYGVPMQELAEQLLNITSQPVPSDGGWVKSLPDAIGQAMLRHIDAKSERAGKATGSLCPECGAPLRFEEGCSGGKCICGFSRC
ncbi:MAG: adenosylcobalamin-dependent ribonucleoside-diphosphate reductase [Planctomycetes bacterium]|nr:adenosylcobalamin-dependent ribonucleoside-diphosphate reductase [Planctomycetota bacterium]